MNARISTIVYASLTMLAVVAAAAAKGYVHSLGEFSFMVAVSAVGLFVAHFWSQTLARRLTGGVTKAWLRHEAIDSSAMLIPGVALVAIGAVFWVITGSEEISITAAMSGLTLLLFAYTWLGTRAFLWSLGTAGVGVLMILFKVVA